jgi:hypothetical protein
MFGDLCMGGGCECVEPCDTCNDISGTKSVLLTFPDISTVTDFDPGNTSCPDCESYNGPVELLAMNNVANAIAQVDNFAVYGCNTDSGRIPGTTCGYIDDYFCNTISTQFAITRFAATYRTTGNDLRMFVAYLMTYNDNLGCFGTVVASDDFLLASDAFKFDCLDLDHDGTFTICSGSAPACGCSAPSDYNVAMIAA